MMSLKQSLKLLAKNSKSELEKDIFQDIVSLPVNTINNLKKNHEIDLSEDDFNKMIDIYMSNGYKRNSNEVLVYWDNDNGLENVMGSILSFDSKNIIIKIFDTPKGILCKPLKRSLSVGVIFEGIKKPFNSNKISCVLVHIT